MTFYFVLCTSPVGAHTRSPTYVRADSSRYKRHSREFAISPFGVCRYGLASSFAVRARRRLLECTEIQLGRENRLRGKLYRRPAVRVRRPRGAARSGACNVTGEREKSKLRYLKPPPGYSRFKRHESVAYTRTRHTFERQLENHFSSS